MEIGKSLVKGLFWVMLTEGALRILNLAVTVVLARLLVPRDFGLVALAFAFIGILMLFQDFGIGTALIQRRKDIEKAANTAFLFIPFLGILLFLVSFFLAPFAGQFFSDSLIEPIIKVLSLTLIISSLGTVPSVLLDRNLQFRKKFLPETVSVLLYAFTAVVLALNNFGVWSIVFGQIAGRLSWLAMIWIVSPFRPKMELDLKIFKELFSYGKHVIFTTIFLFILIQGDNLFIGKIAGTAALGFYALAYTVSNIPATSITQIITKALFPAYSFLQDSKERLKKTYFLALKYTSLLSFPAALGLLALAPEITVVVFGTKWLPMVPVFQILCVFALFRSLGAVSGSVFNAVGKPEILKNITFLNMIAMIALIVPLTIYYGIFGAAIAVTISQIFAIILALYKVSGQLNEKFLKIILPLNTALISSFVMFAVLIAVKPFLPLNFLFLSLEILLGIAVYSAAIYFTEKQVFKEAKQILQLLNEKKEGEK